MNILIPERICSICGEKFIPKLKKNSEQIYIWKYHNYCSTSCFEIAENTLFNFLYEINSILPQDIRELVNENALHQRKEEDIICQKKIEDIELIYSEDFLERKIANLLDLPLGSYLEKALNDPIISTEARKILKPGKGQKKCPSCGLIMGVKKRICHGCDYDFRRDV